MLVLKTSNVLSFCDSLTLKGWQELGKGDESSLHLGVLWSQTINLLTFRLTHTSSLTIKTLKPSLWQYWFLNRTEHICTHTRRNPLRIFQWPILFSTWVDVLFCELQSKSLGFRSHFTYFFSTLIGHYSGILNPLCIIWQW